jgi:dihydroorotate dehydrogenase (NAD+) catalytic subunit
MRDKMTRTSAPDLSVDLGFLKLRNPVLTASGTFGYGLEFKPFTNLDGLGGIVVKGLYFNPRPGNPPPRLAEAPAGLINSIGLQGIGVRAFCENVLPRLQRLKTPIIVNVCGETDEEYAAVIDFLNKERGVAAFELNISCPNVEKRGICPALSPDHTFALVKLAKKTSRLPLIVKLSPNVTDIVSVALAAEEAGADALSLINTLLAMAVDVETRRPRLANTFGGLSGPAVKPVALRMVYQVASRVGIPVIGLGGIMTGRDALEFLVVGAKAVEVGTANLIDPGAAVRIIREIQVFCREKKIPRIEGHHRDVEKRRRLIVCFFTLIPTVSQRRKRETITDRVAAGETGRDKMEKEGQPKEKIIIALDVGTKREALALTEALGEARVFKIGLELFTAEGPALIKEVERMGKRPFLDLKFHDIPNTRPGRFARPLATGPRCLPFMPRAEKK